MPSHTLITGGAGFIGSHLADLLLLEGHSVTVLDDLSTGSLSNIAQHLATPNFTFHRGSIFDEALLTSLIDRCDLVYHLAATVGVHRILERPVESLRTNVSGTETVLRLAAARGRRVILASTSEVYGRSTALPFREDGDLVLGSTAQSRWGYACAKAIDEFMALAWHAESGLPVTIVRLFNTSGPRQSSRYGMVLPTFVGQALRGDPITVFGTGEQSRCFTHVTDIVEAMAAIPAHPATIGEVYNLGSTAEITVNDLALRVREATGSASPIRHIPYHEAYAPGFADMPRRLPDITKARAAFGFHPSRSLDEILASLIDDLGTRPPLSVASSELPF